MTPEEQEELEKLRDPLVIQQRILIQLYLILEELKALHDDQCEGRCW